MTSHEEDLLTCCLMGDPDGWEEFTTRYSKLVYDCIQKTLLQYHYPARSEILDELYQDFFLALMVDSAKKLRQFRGENNCSLASWIRVLSSRLAIDFLRRENSIKKLSRGPFFCTDGDLIRSLIEQEDKSFLDRACLALPARDQQLLQLHYLEELPAEKAAAILKISIGAFYAQKSRILKKLRTTLKTFAAL